jgi:hypothetical protein
VVAFDPTSRTNRSRADIALVETNDVSTVNATAPVNFPPPGWIVNREAARLLGVGLETLTCGGWKWHSMLRGQGKCVRHPVTGGRCNIYPLEVIGGIQAAQAAAAVPPPIPEGFLDKEGACRMFGVTGGVWKRWVREGKVRFGEPSPAAHNQKIYALKDLQHLKEELFSEERLYKDGENNWHIPAGYVRREEAWAQFGVGMPTWWRWEREGRITCGQRVPGGPKLYKLEDIQRMLDEYGRYCPPYPDPDRPGAYRVPLSGRDIKRREALIDAEDLPLIEGASCAWSRSGDWGFVSVTRGEMHGVPLRRLILGVSESDSNVRHANGDSLDCRRANLVVRTPVQRSRNARKIKSVNGRPTTSRFKGVFWETHAKSWRARIRVDGKQLSLGRYRDEIAAAQAYDEAARQFFGEHARLNFPDGVDAWLEKEFRTEAPSPAGEERAAA